MTTGRYWITDPATGERQPRTGTMWPVRRRDGGLTCGRPVPHRGYCGELVALVSRDADGEFAAPMFGMIEDPPGSQFWRPSNAMKRQLARGPRAAGHAGRAIRAAGDGPDLLLVIRRPALPWRQLCRRCGVLVEVSAAALTDMLES